MQKFWLDCDNGESVREVSTKITRICSLETMKKVKVAISKRRNILLEVQVENILNAELSPSNNR